jgi:hypothetical protein
MTPLILCVDDEPSVLASLARGLRTQFTIHTALSGAEALAILEQGGPYAAILADMRMPGMNGLEFLAQAAILAPDTVGAMLTGNVDQATAVKALNARTVNRFITKPASTEVIAETLQECCRIHEQLREKRRVLERALEGGVSLLTEIYQAANKDALGDGALLADYVSSFFHNIHANQQTPRELEIALMLRWIGGAAIPGTLMRRAAQGEELSPAEQQLIQSAASAGIQLLYALPGMESVARILHYQGKGYDGSGVPEDSVKGEEIPFGSRILRVMVDLLKLERSGLSRMDAIMRLGQRGIVYDPEILRLCRLRWQFDKDAKVVRVTEPVTVENLCISDVLAFPVQTIDKKVVAPEGMVLTAPLLRRIRALDTTKQLDGKVFVSLLKRA